ATADNTTLAQLVTDLGAALGSALTTAGFASGALAVTTDLGTLIVTAVDPSIVKLTIHNAQALGFSADQASVRSGDRLFFVTDRGDLGHELWKSDETGTALVQGRVAGADVAAQHLTAVGDTLYFSGFDPASGQRVLWRSVGGAAPSMVPGQALVFSDPQGLINARGILVFSARPAGETTDREVFSFDGATFRKISAVPGTASNPTGLTSFGAQVLFAAEDSSPGSTLQAGLTGRELWSANPIVVNSATLLKNIAPDVDPSTITQQVIVGFTPIITPFGIIFVPIFGTVTTTVPGTIGSSSPEQLTVAGNAVYFSADDGSNGREIWKTDGTGVNTVLVKDVLAGPSGSNPTDLTPVTTTAGLRLFFVADGGLWVSDGTATGTVRIAQDKDGDAIASPSGLTAVGDQLFFQASGRLWVTDGTQAGTSRFDTIVPAGVPRAGRTPLEIDPRTHGLLADLYTGAGQLVTRGKSTIDLRAVEAGSFYLRVYTPTATPVVEDLPFAIAVDAPIQGYSHPIPD